MRKKPFPAAASLAILGMMIGAPLLALPGSGSRTRQGTRLPPIKEVKTTRVGDVTISNFDSASGSIDFSNTTLTGRNTLVEAPDAASHGLLKLHANKIHLLHPNDRRTGRIDLTGEVTYTLTQPLPDGSTRTVEGTAGTATFARGTRKITLRDGPHVSLNDPVRLAGPAHLRAGELDIDMSVTPYKITATGDPGDSEVRFTPRETPGQAGKPGGEITIHHFNSGAFQAGEQASFDGPETTLETTSPADNSHERLQANHVEAAFGADHSTLQQASAEENVRYRIDRPGANGKRMESISGRSAAAVYTPSASEIAFTGSVVASLYDPAALQEPAQLTGDRVVAHIVEPIRYEVSGSSQHTSLKFSPRKAPPASGVAPATSAFAFGAATIHGFVTAVFEPRKQVVFTGEKTNFQAGDAKAGSSAQITAPRLVATFLDDRSIGRTEASGNVRFHVSQPAASGKTRQSVDGASATATFVTNAQTREIQATGPMRIEVNDSEHLKEPGHISGETDDTLKFNLASQVYEFEIDSKNQTAKVDFVPLDSETTPSAPAIVPPAPKAGGKKPLKK